MVTLLFLFNRTSGYPAVMITTQKPSTRSIKRLHKRTKRKPSCLSRINNYSRINVEVVVEEV